MPIQFISVVVLISLLLLAKYFFRDDVNVVAPNRQKEHLQPFCNISNSGEKQATTQRQQPIATATAPATTQVEKYEQPKISWKKSKTKHHQLKKSLVDVTAISTHDATCNINFIDECWTEIKVRTHNPNLSKHGAAATQQQQQHRTILATGTMEHNATLVERVFFLGGNLFSNVWLSGVLASLTNPHFKYNVSYELPGPSAIRLGISSIFIFTGVVVVVSTSSQPKW